MRCAGRNPADAHLRPASRRPKVTRLASKCGHPNRPRARFLWRMRGLAGLFGRGACMSPNRGMYGQPRG